MANGLSSALVGAGTGAAIGSAVPVIGTGAGALIGGLLGYFGSSSENKNTKKNMRYQTDLNKEEMAYSQSLNKQYQEYLNNTQYGAQVAGMKNAGLNPSGANSSVGAMQASNSMQTGPSGPQGASDVADLGRALEAAKSIKDFDLMDAQKKNIEAQTQNIEADTSTKSNQNAAFWDQWNKEMENLDATIKESKSRTGVNEKRQQEIAQSIDNMKESLNQIRETVNQLKASTAESKVRANLLGHQAKNWDSFIKSQIAHNLASANLLTGQNAREGMTYLVDMSSAAAMADYYDNNSRALRIQTQWNEFLMKQDKKWNEFKQWLNVGTQVLNCVGDNFYKVANGISSFVPLTSHSYSSGYTPLGSFMNESYTTQRRGF